MNTKLTRIDRLGSMLLDHVVICFTLLPILIVSSMLLNLLGISKPFESHPLETAGFYVVAVIYFNKDFIGGRSVAKRMLGSIVVDNKTRQPAGELRCLLRNLTIPLWPLEVLVTLVSPSRRIGDFLANTRIEKIESKQDVPTILGNFKSIKLTPAGIIALVATIPLAIGVTYSINALINLATE